METMSKITCFVLTTGYIHVDFWKDEAKRKGKDTFYELSWFLYMCKMVDLVYISVFKIMGI